MKKHAQKLWAIILMLTISISVPVYALPPQAEADMLMIDAKKLMDDKQYAEAVDKFKRVLDLKVRVPDTFSFHYGYSLVKSGQYGLGKNWLDSYITDSGSGGKFYKEALVAYSIAEKEEERNRVKKLETDRAAKEEEERIRVKKLEADRAIAQRIAEEERVAAIEADKIKQMQALDQQRYLDMGDTLKDIETGVIWTKSSSSDRMEWGDAKDWCSNKGSGWSLPTISELRGLIDSSKILLNRHLFISPSFNLHEESIFWSGERSGFFNGWFVRLDDSNAYQGYSAKGTARAATVGVLCVKRP